MHTSDAPSPSPDNNHITAAVTRPRPSRPSRTRSLPSRIHSTSQVLASISEEYGDGHDHITTTASAGTQPTAQPKLEWSKSDPSPISSGHSSVSGNGNGNTRPKNKAKLRIRTSPKSTKPNAFSQSYHDRDCGICFDPAVRPSRTKCCGKMFCEEHLHDWLNGSSNHCPVCASKCHPATGTISLAPPMTPTIHNSPLTTPPLPRTPPSPGPPRTLYTQYYSQPLLVQTPSPIRPSSTYFSTSPISESDSSSKQPRVASSLSKNEGNEAQGPTKFTTTPLAQSQSTSFSSSSPRSPTLLPMLNAVSQNLTHKLARGLVRRQTNADTTYVSSALATQDPPLNGKLLPSFNRSQWSPLWPKSPSFYFSSNSYYSFDFPFNFDFDFGPHSHTTNNNHRPSSPFPTYSSYPTDSSRTQHDSRAAAADALVRDLTEVGRKMFARVLSMVGMLLVLHVLFLGKTTVTIGSGVSTSSRQMMERAVDAYGCE
ncbi:hypothetical protein GGU10DRAFT_147923 [Lentinula aff. detonsa]|uniref:RING-type domain-containing protein n=1 Tax=Lentinula aff. detonsa TaxID=2804958 RepID=A0AA38L6G2_9AGAR|nr:hypothetical protein GGU10DRAFT_147923 [Lentinula aff. detonsa]